MGPGTCHTKFNILQDDVGYSFSLSVSVDKKYVKYLLHALKPDSFTFVPKIKKFSARICCYVHQHLDCVKIGVKYKSAEATFNMF